MTNFDARSMIGSVMFLAMIWLPSTGYNSWRCYECQSAQRHGTEDEIQLILHCG